MIDAERPSLAVAIVPWMVMALLGWAVVTALAWALMQKADPIVLEGVACKVTTLRAAGTR